MTQEVTPITVEIGDPAPLDFNLSALLTLNLDAAANPFLSVTVRHKVTGDLPSDLVNFNSS